MELDLDKEIDALLRRTDFSPDGSGVPELGHLGADEIAAFADNAVPDAGRAVYMRHIAACSSCRKTLSHVIALNAESVEQHEEAAASDVKTAGVPWYGGLFTLTRLAYAMGGLAVIFAGFLAFSVLRGTGGRSTEVSQVSDEPQARTSAPNSAATPFENSYSASAANSNAGMVAKGPAEPLANAAANTTIVAAGPAAAKPSAAELNKSKSAENSFEVDGASGSAASPPPPPPPPASTADSVTALRKDDKAAEKERSNLPMTARRVDGLQAMRQAETQADNQAKAPSRRTAVDLKSKVLSGPSRDMNSQIQNSANQITQLPSNGRNVSRESGPRNVAGRVFEFKQGVWYDKSFAGERTINVRRGTEAYRQLDSGLRAAADDLGGTVVIVWKSKAYRIQ